MSKGNSKKRSTSQGRPQPSRKAKYEEARKLLAPDSAVKDLGLNYYSLPTEKPTRPANGEKTTDAIAKHLCDKKKVLVAKCMKLGKYIEIKAPGFPVLVKNEEGVSTEEQLFNFEVAKAKSIAQSRTWANKLDTFDEDKYHACELVLGQCTSALKDRVQVDKSYEDIYERSDVVALLNLVQICSNGHGGRGYFVKNALCSLRRVVECRQFKGESNRNFFDRLEANVNEYEQYGGELFNLMSFADVPILEKLSSTDKESRIKAMLVVDNACNVRYSGYKEWLHNKAIAGEDAYPKDWSSAIAGLEEYRGPPASTHGAGDDIHTGSSFAQGGIQVPGRDGKVRDLTCWNCQKPGHIKPQCPDIPVPVM